MSPEETQHTKDMMEKVAGVAALVMPVVMVPVSCLVAAAVLLLMVNFVFGGNAAFKGLWAVACLGWAPKAIEMILIGVLRRVQGTVQVGFTPAVLLPDNGSMVRSILGVFDLFDFWMLGIHIVGVGVVASLPQSKARNAVLTTWIVYWVLAIGAAAIGNLLKGVGGA
jgi:hypothetical protein